MVKAMLNTNDLKNKQTVSAVLNSKCKFGYKRYSLILWRRLYIARLGPENEVGALSVNF